jgi:hypothetical protein
MNDGILRNSLPSKGLHRLDLTKQLRPIEVRYMNRMDLGG